MALSHFHFRLSDFLALKGLNILIDPMTSMPRSGLTIIVKSQCIFTVYFLLYNEQKRER